MVFGSRWRVFLLDERDQIHNRCPRRDVEHAVVIGVEIVTVGPGEFGDQKVGDVVGVFEVEVGGQVGGAQGEGALGGDEVAAGGIDWPVRSTTASMTPEPPVPSPITR